MNEEQINDFIDNHTPSWIKAGLTLDDLRAIEQGGCASGAYMPAVTYHCALEAMALCGDEIFDYLDEYGMLETIDISSKSWAGMACAYVSMAVELWAGSLLAKLEDIECEECGSRLEWVAVCDDNGHQIDSALECSDCENDDD